MLVTSEQQTNGRGRVGKKWISEKGNLFILTLGYISFSKLIAFPKYEDFKDGFNMQ